MNFPCRQLVPHRRYFRGKYGNIDKSVRFYSIIIYQTDRNQMLMDNWTYCLEYAHHFFSRFFSFLFLPFSLFYILIAQSRFNILVTQCQIWNKILNRISGCSNNMSGCTVNNDVYKSLFRQRRSSINHRRH